MKDLVDHIRTVHFTVFLVALILTIALRGPTKPHLERAASDAEAILFLEQNWQQVTDAFSKAADAESSGPRIFDTSGVQDVFLEPGRYEVRGLSVYPNRPVIFDIPKRWVYVDGAEEDENIGWGESEELFDKLPSSWKTLKEFLKFWDDHHDGTRAFLPFALATRNGISNCNAVKSVTEKREVTAFLVPHSKFKEGWRLWTSLEAMDRDINKHKTACEFADLPVDPLRINLGNVLGGIASQNKRWGTGKSGDEFKDLIAESKYLDEMPLKQLAAVLRERANTDTERVELFQAKIPVEALATYGALVLVICQFYLLAHLLELRRLTKSMVRSDWPTGYIGLYENRFIFVFTLISMAVWPPLPIMLLARSTTTDRFSRYFAWGALIASITIAIASAATLAVIRKTNPSKQLPTRARAKC